ncbi:NUDIX domain-containing protein [Aeromicrobium camelliae]|uniref:NUDIX domain-containing protein n=1 Tax=Aeromicrobium camelliae TaxID=1538144 RepID=A0A3N6WRX7_9ACTN|nr:NUDIX domain-containing protein [Aeromicrobium camelliae]RQN10050.1 NUDIX domain-containing protein [Aeromicrobium camelliae]
MTVRSAGILLFRRSPDVEVLLGHMGGPFWSRKHEGAWSIPKGEVEPDEDPWAAACREFGEELGVPLPTGTRLPLGEVRQSRKLVEAWAVEGDLDPARITPGTFEMEWPPRSGTRQQFPEVDRVEWFDLDTASEVIVAGQRALLDRLRAQLG